MYATESLDEVRQFLKLKKAYVNTDGTMIYDTQTDTINYVLWNMTGAPEAVPA